MKYFNGSKGFTLIELLATIAIIGILAAIAIPQFAIYRARSMDVQALSDLRTAMTAEEAYFQAEGVYLDTICTDGVYEPELPGADCTPGVVLEMVTVGDTVFGNAYAPSGSGTEFTYSSAEGQIQTNYAKAKPVV